MVSSLNPVCGSFSESNVLTVFTPSVLQRSKLVRTMLTYLVLPTYSITAKEMDGGKIPDWLSSDQRKWTKIDSPGYTHHPFGYNEIHINLTNVIILASILLFSRYVNTSIYLKITKCWKIRRNNTIDEAFSWTSNSIHSLRLGDILKCKNNNENRSMAWH